MNIFWWWFSGDVKITQFTISLTFIGHNNNILDFEVGLLPYISVRESLVSSDITVYWGIILSKAYCFQHWISIQELLRHFWSSYPITTSYLYTKVSSDSFFINRTILHLILHIFILNVDTYYPITTSHLHPFISILNK